MKKKLKIKQKSKIKICDDLWKKAIVKRANGKCEVCGEMRYVQAHHIVPRTCYTLRHDMENGVALCRKHHIYWAHKDCIAFYNWAKDLVDMDYLESRRHLQAKNDYDLIKLHLEGQL